MNQVFNLCVAILQETTAITGLTYQEANIWIFVIIHPLLTILFFWGMLKYRKKWKKEVFVNQKSIQI